MLTSQVLGTRFQEVLLTAPSASLWAPWFLRMLEGQGKPAVPDRGRFSKQQVAPRMPRDEIAGSSVTRGPQCHCLLCPHKERGASSFLTPRALPGLVETLAQACQMPTSLREQGKLLKSGGRSGRAGHQGAGSSQVLRSGSTHSKYTT